jgi:hypothetical protein
MEFWEFHHCGGACHGDTQLNGCRFALLGIGVPVSNFERSKRFYAQALSPLGYELLMEPSASAAGFGRRGKPDFWISQGQTGQAFHIAFAAEDRATVAAFYDEAIAAGGRDNGGPGLRPRFGRQ